MNIVSHFARADEPNAALPNISLTFYRLRQGKPGQRSLLPRLAVSRCGRSLTLTGRPGIIFVCGVSPLGAQTSVGFSAGDVLNLRLIAVRDHKAGEPVGYGGHG